MIHHSPTSEFKWPMHDEINRYDTSEIEKILKGLHVLEVHYDHRKI